MLLAARTLTVPIPGNTFLCALAKLVCCCQMMCCSIHACCPLLFLQILREKRAAAEVATAGAIAAARQLHFFVSDLNGQHHLMQRAAQAAVAQAQAAAGHAMQQQHLQQYQQLQKMAAGRTVRAKADGGIGAFGSRVGSQQHLEQLAAFQQQHVKDEHAEQQHSPVWAQPTGGAAPGDAAAALQAAATAAVPADADIKAASAAAAVAEDVHMRHGDGEDDANADDLEAAALLGSLHDLAAVAGGRRMGDEDGDALDM